MVGFQVLRDKCQRLPAFYRFYEVLLLDNPNVII